MTRLRGAALFCAAAFALLCAAAGAQTAADVPKHLAIARELVDNIKPENNRYDLGGQYISFPSDFLSNKYAMKADCSGFLLAIFDRAKYGTQMRMAYLNSFQTRRRPDAEDFVYSIEKEKGFKHIAHVTNMRPGDLLAHAMLKSADKLQTGTTGHVFLIDSFPKKIEPRSPVVAGTGQFEVSIIDSNAEWLGDDDTRLRDPEHKVIGLGRGTIRLYVDANDELVGYARTFRNTKRFFSYSPQFPSDTKLRKAAIGRPEESQ